MVAVAGVAWATFGRDKNQDTVVAGPKASTSAPPNQVQGPRVPGATTKASVPTVTPTSSKPVAGPVVPTVKATATAAVPTPTPTPTPAPAASPAPSTPVAPPPAVVPPAVTGPQQAGTVAKKDYIFRIARGDTMWDLTRQALAATGRSTSNATIASYVSRFAAKNASAIGADPDLIVPGQTVVWPTGL